jgi:hypothetical protein
VGVQRRESSSQKIVYVRPSTPAIDRSLAHYLENHDVWIVEPDDRPYKLDRVHDSLAPKMAKQEAMASPPGDYREPP